MRMWNYGEAYDYTHRGRWRDPHTFDIAAAYAEFVESFFVGERFPDFHGQGHRLRERVQSSKIRLQLDNSSTAGLPVLGGQAVLQPGFFYKIPK